MRWSRLGPTESVIEVRMRAEPGADADALLDARRAASSTRTSTPANGSSRASASPTFEVGPLAQAHEAPITAFHEHVLAMLR